MAEHDDPGTVQFRLGGLVRQLSVLEFSVALGLYTDEFMKADNFPHLHCHIHHSPSSYWIDLMPATGIYDPSRSKASALALALCYLYALLAHTLIGRQKSIGVINTHEAYFLWSMRRTHILSHHQFIGQFMRLLHYLKFLTTFIALSNIALSDSTAPRRLYNEFANIFTYHLQHHHPTIQLSTRTFESI
ncbi:hypothetical protein PVK06_046561 [Gossypium arboreum]|uniref:Uncharacterized protein n=1 Tax=Gossypium arboreum TaxID=29729 RepID=A0ABR0MB73_GOSAR|nr:hypothetical protein PVK06_046561 [Gossypium arboreum]